MTFTAYDLMWLTYAAMLVVLLWPRASRDVSAVLLLHGKALGLLYQGVRQGVGNYLGQMGLRQRKYQLELEYVQEPKKYVTVNQK